MSTTFSIRSVYNFDVYPAGIISSSFKGVTVLAVMDRNTANKEIDTQAMHVQVYPYLPTGTVNDPDGYDYVKIKTISGQTTILGLAWIKEDTIELVESKTVTVVIGDVTSSDVPRISAALIQNGFSNISVTIK